MKLSLLTGDKVFAAGSKRGSFRRLTIADREAFWPPISVASADGRTITISEKSMFEDSYKRWWQAS